MNRLFLMNGFRELKNSVNQLKDKFYEFKFGLSLISQKRYNYYFNVFMLSSAAVTTGTYFSFHSVPYMMNKWKSTVHMYQYGEKWTMDEELHRFSRNVWNECNQKLNKPSDKIDFFLVVGSDVISFGSLGLPMGAQIGIPFPFTYKSLEDVKTTDFRFLGEHNPYAKWRSESGQLFLKSVVLSDNAKKFAIGRQIFAANNINVLVDSLNVGLSTVIALGLAQAFLNTRKAPFYRTLPAQLVIRTISLCVGFYVWVQMNKVINYFTSLRADKKAISLGDDYLNGAIEYYSKLKVRNSKFIELMDPNLWTMRPFTEEGELRGPTKYFLTYEKRINYLLDLKNRLKDDKNFESEENLK